MAVWARGLLGTLALLVLSQILGVTEGLNRWVSDAHWRWRASASRTPFPPQIVVVAIDEPTLAKLGRTSEWSRREYAQLLDRLCKASAVGIDVLFPDRVRRNGRDDDFAAAMRRQGH